MNEPLVVRRVAGAIGAEVSGVDLSRDLDPDTVAALRQALLDHLVIFLRDQPIEPARFLAFARAFGTPVEYPFVKGLDAFPQIIEVAKLEGETTNFGGIWHSDTVYLDEPPMGSMLLAREIPPQGGDTLFANQYLAYEALSPTFQGLLDGLTAIHSSAKADVSKTREDRIKSGGTAEAGKDYLSYHPAVRTHPETGRKALFVNVAHTERFDGMTEAESKPILDYLFQHQIRPEFTCRFIWSPGAIAFWDNRCAQHNPVNDYHGYRRIMHRITLAGDRPA
ncbi:MAG: alpha-ketoglutarate-dependent taurine dioxygenase [Minwuia thermotolerans]|nr:MAG: alpha-ketoglutarate-dependent taurine dioxygenase [Minwuia thermotolerans]